MSAPAGTGILARSAGGGFGGYVAAARVAVTMWAVSRGGIDCGPRMTDRDCSRQPCVVSRPPWIPSAQSTLSRCAWTFHKALLHGRLTLLIGIGLSPATTSLSSSGVGAS